MENWEIGVRAWPSLSKVAVGKFLLFLACRLVVRTVVLNAHAHYYALSNMLALLEECLGSGWEVRVWGLTLESSAVLSARYLGLVL